MALLNQGCNQHHLTTIFGIQQYAAGVSTVTAGRDTTARAVATTGTERYITYHDLSQRWIANTTELG